MAEHVLNYDHAVVPQEQYWDCGPGSTQVVLNGRGIIDSENDLIGKIGTTENGTDDISWVLRALGPALPDAGYQAAYIPNDPPTQQQKDKLWADIVSSVNAGYGVVANIVAPPSNYPVGVKGSLSPSYGGGTVFHYIALMGYDDDPLTRAVWVADPGFRPFGYWISLEQLATLIPPKGYAYATANAVVQAPDPVPEPEPAPAGPDPVQVLSDAMLGGVSYDRYSQLLPAVSQCLSDCGCTSVDRIAMWMGQVGEESGGLKWMEEIADGSEYEGRADLGNTVPGDGSRFKGRGPIQVTGRHNYTVLSQWAFDHGLVPSASFFVDSPERLASDQYGFVGVTWYWTTQRPMNDAADAHDIVRATQYVNGGTNGLDDRTNRWKHALSMGDTLLALLGADTGDDPLADPAVIQQINDIHAALFTPLASESIYADPAEGAIWTPVQMIANDDGMLHPLFVEPAALLGDPDAISRVARVAAGKGKVSDPTVIARAQRVLVQIEALNPDVLKAYLAQKEVSA